VGRLVAGQRVTVDLEGEEEVVDALTASDGESRVLAQVQRASPRAVARLVTGSLGYLLFSYKGALIGLRGIARINAATRPLMEFVVVDGAERPALDVHGQHQRDRHAPQAPDGGAPDR